MRVIPGDQHQAPVVLLRHAYCHLSFDSSLTVGESTVTWPEPLCWRHKREAGQDVPPGVGRGRQAWRQAREEGFTGDGDSGTSVGNRSSGSQGPDSHDRPGEHFKGRRVGTSQGSPLNQPPRPLMAFVSNARPSPPVSTRVGGRHRILSQPAMPALWGHRHTAGVTQS